MIPLSYKVESIKAMYVPTKVLSICRFIGLVKYYNDMWRKCTHTIAPLTKPCSTRVNLKWTDVENNDFVSMKKIVGRDVLLSYPIFSKEFIIHTNTRKTAWGSK